MKKFTIASVVLLLLTAASLCRAATLTVTNTADSGPGSLRQAILDANADTSANDVSIEFNIPGSGAQTIAPLTGLPIITRPVTIDGYTQPGASPNTLAAGDNAVLLIQLTGTSLTERAYGLLLAANDCTVRGLVVNLFTNYVVGILVDGEQRFGGRGQGNVIEGNFLGTDATGTNVLTTLDQFGADNTVGQYDGVAIYTGSNNRVGGLTPASRNIIGGNFEGIGVAYGSVSNQIFGNYVGLGADGLTVVPNGYGVGSSTSSQNQVGGPTPGARNVISGNEVGCFVGGSNMVQGNFIGTDVSGTLRRGNAYGVTVQGISSLVGGPGAGEGNLISGNGSAGVGVEGNNNVVAGNLIGTDVTGTSALGNDVYAVLVRADQSGSSSGNVIGGTNAGAGNVITGSQVGVALGASVTDTAATNNAVLGNSIFGNGLPGIDVGNNGVTANDPGDADDAPNHLQNFPEITSVQIAGRNLKVEYRVDSTPANSAYPLTVEFFIADAGQGRTFIYRTTYTSPQAVDKTTFKPVVSPALGDQIVSTATDAHGNTSEFSSPIAVARPGQSGK